MEDRRKNYYYNKRFLILEKDETWRNKLSALFQKFNGCCLTFTEDISELLQICEKNYYDVIILSSNLPQVNENELISKIKIEQQYADLIICTTKQLKSQKEIEYLELGVEHTFNKKKDLRLLELMLENIFKARQLMYYDQFTSSLSKALLEPILHKEILKLNSNPDYHLIMTTIDYNKFKQINDTNGHDIGDKILERTSMLIKDAIRTTDLFFRTGGDEFCLIMPELPLESAKEIMRRICDIIKADPEIKKLTNVDFSISVGIIEGQSGDSEHKLKVKADIAMYSAKRKQKDIVFHAKGGEDYESF